MKNAKFQNKKKVKQFITKYWYLWAVSIFKELLKTRKTLDALWEMSDVFASSCMPGTKSQDISAASILAIH